MTREYPLSSILLTAANHTAELLADIERSARVHRAPSGRFQAFEAEFAFERAGPRPRVFSVNRRRARRFPASDEDALITGDLEIPLKDVSARGVGLHAPYDGPPELDAELLVAGRRFRACARAPRLGDRSGLELELEDDPIHLARALLRHRFGAWRFRGEIPGEEITELMKNSGYLALKGEEPMNPRWLEADDPTLGLDFVWVDGDERPVAHISSARAYSHTWVTHQLASLHDHPDRFEARLACYRLLSTVPTLVDDHRALMIAYVNRDKKWHRVLCEDFVRWMNNPEHAIMTAWDRWEPALDAPRQNLGRSGSDPRIGPIDEGALRWIRRHLVRHLPGLTRRALDLDGGDPRSLYLHDAYRAVGIPREREALIARQDGRVMGAALLEISASHLSLFNLFNMAFFFFDPRTTPELRASLLHQTTERYAARGIRNPILVSLPGALAGCEGGIYHLVETMGLMAWSAAGLRQYENFIEYNFGRHRRRTEPVERQP